MLKIQPTLLNNVFCCETTIFNSDILLMLSGAAHANKSE